MFSLAPWLRQADGKASHRNKYQQTITTNAAAPPAVGTHTLGADVNYSIVAASQCFAGVFVCVIPQETALTLRDIHAHTSTSFVPSRRNSTRTQLGLAPSQ